MSKDDKMIKDLQRLIESQDFKSKEELDQFLSSLAGSPIPELPDEVLSEAEKAENLVYQAYGEDIEEGLKLVNDALELDKDCIEAYLFLSELQLFPEIRRIFLEKAIHVGWEKFGGQYLEDHKGHFYGLTETRAFMKALMFMAALEELADNVEGAVEIYEKILELNHNDNMGARTPLFSYLIELEEWDKFKKYDAMFSEEESAQMLFDRALFTFLTQGENLEAKKLLQRGIKANKNVPRILLKSIFIHDLPSNFILGDKSEAEYYCYYSQDNWRSNPGALKWLRKVDKGL